MEIKVGNPWKIRESMSKTHALSYLKGDINILQKLKKVIQGTKLGVLNGNLHLKNK